MQYPKNPNIAIQILQYPKNPNIWITKSLFLQKFPSL